MSINNLTSVSWLHNDALQTANWRSYVESPVPKKIQCIDDTVTADTAFSLASEGIALIWTGDFQNARQLLQAMTRRIERVQSQPKTLTRKHRKSVQYQTTLANISPKDTFNHYRLAQSQRARTLNKLLIVLDIDYAIHLRRAPDWREACTQVYGESNFNHSKILVSLRELLGIVSAYEWRKKGVFIPQLSQVSNTHQLKNHQLKNNQLTPAITNICPYYGVFAPTRQEYLDLMIKVSLPSTVNLAFDIGTGTGILAILLAQRGVPRVIATDTNVNAIQCAYENFVRLGYDSPIDVINADMFPCLEVYGQADLIVCNPPWLPARPNSVLEQAIYDPDSRMVWTFLNGLVRHLKPQGQAWLIMSNLAEHLGLREHDELASWIANAGLVVRDKMNTYPIHSKSLKAQDNLYFARSQEVTSLWVLSLA
jgi:16S rRNA G1207 methylase RsmC